jgi:hypothetical protein
LVHLLGDQPGDAASRFACALRLRREIEADAEWTVSIAGVGAALLATGRPDDAVALLGACDRLAEEDIAVQANPMLQLPFRQSVVATAREALGERYAIVAARLDDFPLQSVVDVALRQADEIDLQ